MGAIVCGAGWHPVNGAAVARGSAIGQGARAIPPEPSMLALMLPLLLIALAIPAALGVLYVAIPVIGMERANAAANVVLMVGGAGMVAGGGWVVWKLVNR